MNATDNTVLGTGGALPADMLTFINRGLSLLVFLTYATGAYYSGGIGIAIKAVAALLLPMACIWFPDPLGELSPVTQSAPPRVTKKCTTVRSQCSSNHPHNRLVSAVLKNIDYSKVRGPSGAFEVTRGGALSSDR